MTYDTQEKQIVNTCTGIRNGVKPSITVNCDQLPMITWETEFFDVQANNWSGTPQSAYRNSVATKMLFEQQSSSAVKVSNEFLFPVKKRTSYAPVIGGDKDWSQRRSIVWYSDTASNGSRRMHSVVGKPNPNNPSRTDWSMKTWQESGYTPILSLSNGGVPLAVYAKDSVSLGGTAIRSFAWTNDSLKFGYTSEGLDSLIELRGATINGSTFSNGVAFAVFEDSLSGKEQPFIAIPDTASILSLQDISNVVKTQTFFASRIRIAINRFAEGIDNATTQAIFNTTNIEWFVEVRNAITNGIIRSEKIARLAKNEAMSGKDSATITFPYQPIYLNLLAETSPDIIGCLGTIRILVEDKMPTDSSSSRWSSLKQSGANSAQFVKSISLDQNTPNPFTPTTEISYTLNGDESKEITLTVFDALGREVMTLAKGEHKPGRYTKVFDGSSLPSGTYIYTLRGDGNSITRRMTLVK